MTPFKIKIKKWVDDLIWCPSQCYGLFKLNNQCFTLYLRWRHEDPWQGHLIVGDVLNSDDDRTWTEDLFCKYNKSFKDKELTKAKKCLINLASKEINNFLSIPTEELPLHINDDNDLIKIFAKIALSNAPVAQQE